MATTRAQHFLRAVVSGYAVLGCNIFYSLASVPLALRYLPREEFGLWALAVQLGGFLSMIDLGMSGSVSRHMIDFKDDRDGGRYGGLLKTTLIVLFTQALLVALLGTAFALTSERWMRIPEHLAPAYRGLMIGQTLIVAVGFPMKFFGGLLVSHHRYDYLNYAHLSQIAAQFCVLWWGFEQGLGIYSLIWALGVGTGVLSLIAILAGFRRRYFPKAGHWGQPSWAQFHELFSFGRDIFWMSLGAQLVFASQTIVIARTLGVDAAAIWSICTRAFTLLQQVAWKIYDYSFPAFSEMLVRGESGLLRRRFSSITVATLSISAVGAVGLAFCNQTFVEVWTHSSIAWGHWNDALLGLCLLPQAFAHCTCGLLPVLKSIGRMRYIYLVEGLVVVLVGSAATAKLGFSGILIVSTIASCVFSGAAGTWRICREFSMKPGAALRDWLLPSVRVLCVLVPCASLLASLFQAWPPVWRLILVAGGTALTGFFALCTVGFDVGFRSELAARLPRSFRPIFLLGGTAP